MKILITGANGFVGSYVAKALEESGHILYRCDLNEADLEVDIGDFEVLDKATEELETIDCIIHFAAIAHNLSHARDDALQYTNVQGTKNIIAIAKKLNVQKFIFSSSITVWEREGVPALIDLDVPAGSSTLYGETKIIGEQAVANAAFKQSHILRFTPIFTPDRLSDVAKRVVLPLGLKMALKPPPSYQFCSLEKACSAVLSAVESNEPGNWIEIVSDSKSYSQSEILDWFPGRKIVIPVVLLKILSRLLPPLRRPVEKLCTPPLYKEERGHYLRKNLPE